MKKIRIGNNIKVSWILRTVSGEPFDLSGLSLELFAGIPNRRFQIENYTVEKNVINWEFKGEEQLWTGPYTITLVSIGDGDRMITVDLCEPFELVERSCLAGGVDGDGFTTETLEFSSDVLVGFPGPQGPQGEKGLSAYELALEEGFKGTISEWLSSLRADAVPLLEDTVDLKTFVTPGLYRVYGNKLSGGLSSSKYGALLLVTPVSSGSELVSQVLFGINYYGHLCISGRRQTSATKWESWTQSAVNEIISKYIDTELNAQSSHAVSNAVVTEAIGKIYDELHPVSLSVSGGGYYKKGTTQNVTVSWKLTESGRVLTPESVTINGVSVSSAELSAGQKVFTGVTSDSSYSMRVDYKSPYSGLVSSRTESTAAKFVDPGYFGAIGSDFEVTESSLVGLTELVRSSRTYNNTVNLEAQRVLYAYPAVFGLLTSIKDANNFEYIGSYEHSQMTLFNVLYNVYILKEPVTAQGFSQTYK